MNHCVTDAEWGLLAPTLGCSFADHTARRAAQAGLYRLNHRLSQHYRTFSWHSLPSELGIAGSTANRFFLRWNRSGQWFAFWDALIELRFGSVVVPAQTVDIPQDPIDAALAEIRRAYGYFNQRFMGGELPSRVVFSIEKSTVKKSRKVLGYFSSHQWQQALPNGESFHHIAFMTSCLSGSHRVMEVLLHEMTHLRNWMLGIDDTDTRTQYHTQDFRDVAQLFGLKCSQRDVSHGYANTSLDERAICEIEALKPISESLTMVWRESDST